MTKATTCTAILLLGFAVLASSEPLRQRFVPRRGLARQELAAPPSPAPTGYPEAGITPEIPFDLPSSTAQPEVSYLPPDNTYGPPDSVYGPPTISADEPAPEPEPEQEPEQPIETDDIPAPEEEEEETPGDVKLQPEPAPEPEDENVLVEVSDDGTVIAVSTTLDQPKSARFYQRFPQGRRREQPVPQRLVLRRNW
ncbi:protein TsetseEP [Drosophila albomicans]|uniref:Protein TsetseEP n=1 Tax=Drosophila albomicans TaxID=7291 RepID=A0A6P8X6V5_DROAB|nr:protein TsetseEP [Drosophila albomicans]